MTNPTLRRFLALSVVLAVVVALAPATPPTHAQDHPPITTANAATLTTDNVRGQGWLQDTFWQGDDVIVAASTGLWRYPPTGPAPTAPFLAHPQDTPPSREIRHYAVGQRAIVLAGFYTLHVYDAEGNVVGETSALPEPDASIGAIQLTANEKAVVVYVTTNTPTRNELLLVPLHDLENPVPLDMPNHIYNNFALVGANLFATGTRDIDDPETLEREVEYVLFNYDLNTNRILWERKNRDDGEPLFVGFVALNVSPDGQQVALSNRGDTVVLDAADGRILGTHRLDNNSDAFDLVVSNDGRVFVTRSAFAGPADFRGTLYAVDVATDSAQAYPDLPGYLSTIALKPDNSRVAYGGYGGTVRVLDITDPAAAPRVLATEFHASADYLYLLNGALWTGGFDGMVRRWNDDGSVDVLAPDNRYVYDLELLPNGEDVAVIAQNSAAFFNRNDFALQADFSDEWDEFIRFNSASGSQIDMARLPGGDIVIAEILLGGDLHLYRIPEGASDLQTTIYEGADANTVAFSPFSNDLLVYGYSLPNTDTPGYLAVYDSSTFEETAQIPLAGTASNIEALLFPDEDEVVLLANGVRECILTFISLSAAAITDTVSSEGSCVGGTLSPVDPDLLVTVDHAGPATLRHLRTGERLGMVDGHVWSVSDVLFTPDGTRLYTSGWDGTIREWVAAGE